MSDSTIYAQIRELAQAGEYQRALDLMRLEGLPTMASAFRTTEANGGTFSMVFRFSSLEDMHRADREWHAFRAAFHTADTQ